MASSFNIPFTSFLGGINSTLGGSLVFGGDPGDAVIATWTVNDIDLGQQEISFGIDEGAHPIKIVPYAPKALTVNQYSEAIANGAHLITIASEPLPSHR